MSDISCNALLRLALKISHSIQRRVFVIFGGFTLFLTIVYSGMNVLIAFVIEDEVLEKVLAYEAQLIESAFRKKGRIIQPRVDYMKLYLDPKKAPKEIALAYKNKSLGNEVFTKDNMHYHIQHLYFDKDNSALLVAEVTPFLTVSNVSRGILVLFSGVFIVALLLSLWLAYKIAKNTTKPIARLANEVMLQQDQNEPFVLSGKHSGDEIGYLANTIEKALTELKISVKRESDFNRDVSHELRTPLTVLNNTLALAENRALSTKDIEQLRNSSARMRHIVTTLVTLARAESIGVDSFLLVPLLEDCVLGVHHKLTEKDFNVHVKVDRGYRVTSNEQLVKLLINNLIENAIAYSSKETLLIRLKDNELSFENEIFKSIGQNKTRHLVDEGIKQDDSYGFGQGLYLVKRILETLDWRYNISSDKSNYRFSIHFK